MADESINPDRVEHPAGAPATPSTAKAQNDGTRTDAGSTYGDFAPKAAPAAAGRDPSRGAELERDDMPSDADFSRRPDHAGAATDPADGQPGNPQRPANTERR